MQELHLLCLFNVCFILSTLLAHEHLLLPVHLKLTLGWELTQWSHQLVLALDGGHDDYNPTRQVEYELYILVG